MSFAGLAPGNFIREGAGTAGAGITIVWTRFSLPTRRISSCGLPLGGRYRSCEARRCSWTPVWVGGQRGWAVEGGSLESGSVGDTGWGAHRAGRQVRYARGPGCRPRCILLPMQSVQHRHRSAPPPAHPARGLGYLPPARSKPPLLGAPLRSRRRSQTHSHPVPDPHAGRLLPAARPPKSEVSAGLGGCVTFMGGDPWVGIHGWGSMGGDPCVGNWVKEAR